MKILGIETSGPQFSLCLNDGEKLLYEIRKERTLCPDTRDGRLFTEVRSMLGYLGKERLGAIAVSIGPGMFTSLRVGLSLAKGLSLAQDIPMVSVNTLEMIGTAVPFLAAGTGPCMVNSTGTNETVAEYYRALYIVPVINAHREEIYAAIYIGGKRKGDYLLTTPVGIVAKTRDMIENEHGQRTFVFVGPDATMVEEAVAKNRAYDIEYRVYCSDAFMPSASKTVAMALPRIAAGDFDDPATLVPFYLKKTDAEIKLGS